MTGILIVQRGPLGKDCSIGKDTWERYISDIKEQFSSMKRKELIEKICT